MYFLRARHCYNCNTELFPAEELTERAYPGAPAQIIEENDHIKRLNDRYPAGCSPKLLLELNAAAEEPATITMARHRPRLVRTGSWNTPRIYTSGESRRQVRLGRTPTHAIWHALTIFGP
jgi:hypothetical protein